VLIAGGTTAALTAGNGEQSALLFFLLAPKEALDHSVAAAPATVNELYRTASVLKISGRPCRETASSSAPIQKSAPSVFDSRHASTARLTHFTDPETAMSTRPPTANVTICACEEGHVAAVTTIYAHHVLHGLASFEIVPPSEKEMRRRRLDIVSRNYPYLVAECAGEVVGYAYASPYQSRPASRGRAQRRHVREKATIDRLVRGSSSRRRLTLRHALD
jgi:hypothetical protein